MEKLKPCPFCGGETRTRIGVGTLTYFYCQNPECGAIISFTGKRKNQPNVFEAENPVGNFNRRTAPENKPLTLEQLQQMCEPNRARMNRTEPYPPVWIVTLVNNKISCQVTKALIKSDCRYKPPLEYIDAHMVGLRLSDYGKTWLAYARKPEDKQ